jgi:hypothetical protein
LRKILEKPKALRYGLGMPTKHDRALAAFLVGLDDVVDELRVAEGGGRSKELAERLTAMGRQLKEVAPSAARGVPVAEAAEYLGVAEPTVRLWAKRGALALVPDSKTVQVDHESLRTVGRALRELRERGQERDWLEAVLRYVEDIEDRSSSSVRKGLRELAEGKLQPA